MIIKRNKKSKELMFYAQVLSHEFLIIFINRLIWKKNYFKKYKRYKNSLAKTGLSFLFQHDSMGGWRSLYKVNTRLIRNKLPIGT